MASKYAKAKGWHEELLKLNKGCPNYEFEGGLVNLPAFDDERMQENKDMTTPKLKLLISLLFDDRRDNRKWRLRHTQ